MQEKGYCYFDWNVSSGDAVSREQPKNTIIENCKKVPKSNTIVVLLHDSAVKNTTVEALPEIIAYYKSMGYSFGVLSEKTYPVHQKSIIDVCPIFVYIQYELKLAVVILHKHLKLF